MIPPKLLPSQELSLRRITLQQHGLVSHFASHDAGTLNASIHSANVSGTSSSFPRQSASRSELTSPLTLSGPGQVSSPFLPTKTPNSSFGPITGGGTNSTAPASIARPAIRDSKKWASALENVAGFDFPEHQLHASQPSTRERIMVQYVSDKYDRQWIAQRENSKMTTARAIATKGKTGSIDYPNAASSSAVSSSPASRHTITISLLEDLITAFELGTYLNPEIPIQRQPVLTFDGVIATGADASIIEEVRVYWLGKRQALGGNIPCIPSIHINVAEDNQMSLCHNDVLQFCPLPFNHREWSNTVLQRRIPHAHEEKNMRDTSSGVVKVEEGKATGQKRRRCDTGQALSGENTISENANEAASENEEWRALLTSGLELARAILDREEMKLVQTHVELYELAFLRKLAIEGRQSTETDASASLHTPQVNDEALEEDWLGEDAVAVGSVMAIGKGLF